MTNFYDFAGNEINAISLVVAPDGEQRFVIRTDCRSGFFLSAETISEIEVFARITGSLDWINIATDPIDLSPWDSLQQDFEIKLEADADAEISTREVKLKNAR